MGKKIKSGKLVRSAGHPGRMNVGEPVYPLITEQDVIDTMNELMDHDKFTLESYGSDKYLISSRTFVGIIPAALFDEAMKEVVNKLNNESKL